MRRLLAVQAEVIRLRRRSYSQCRCWTTVSDNAIALSILKKADHPLTAHLRPGASAALLSHDKKLELYRASAKKTNDPELSFEFAVFLIEAAKSLETAAATGAAKGDTANEQKRDDLIREAVALLKTLSSRGHPDAQYFLADCYANGIGTVRGKQDFEKAFPLFVLAAKHGHPDAAYRAGTCCEHGWGCRRESAKAVQFYRKAAASLHAGAMYRLGTAELNGALGLAMRPKEGVKWLKRSAENATPEFPHALHELALLHERGIDNVLFVDLEYASELLAQAAELGYAPSAFKLGECYEYGRMGCPQDAALSIHYYVSPLPPTSSCPSDIIPCLEHCRTARSPRRLLCPDGMVPRRLARRAPAIRYRSLSMGQESRRTGPGKGAVCRRVLYRGEFPSPLRTLRPR